MILVAGSANLDFVVQALKIPVAGETVLGHDFKTYPGGKGANQAVACARTGAVSTQFLLALGNDDYAVALERSLTDASVRLHVVRDLLHPTGTAFICVSDDAENAITVAPGANLSLRPQHLPSLTGVSHLLMQLETHPDTVTAYAQAARLQGVKVVLNAAPARPLTAALLALIDVLVINEGELFGLAPNHDSIGQCLDSLDVPMVVVTLGALGCCARVNGQMLIQAAPDIDAIDTTAAGDTFCGVLVAALSQQHGIAMAMKMATAAGALACTQRGAQDSIPSHAQLNAFMQKNTQVNPYKAQALRDRLLTTRQTIP